MTDAEINEIVSRILRARLEQFGFAQSRVNSESDFEGSPIIRVTARYENGRVPSNQLTDSLHAIRSELLRRGEERFVFLDSEYPGQEEADEDTE
jgi:hypothetical protein